MMTIPIEQHLPAENYEEALGRACRMWGVQEEYWDIWGDRHIASADVRRAVLTSLGVVAGSTEALNDAMEERTWNEWSSVVSRTLVESQSAAGVPIQVPVEREGGRLQVEFAWENGGHEPFDFAILELADVGRIIVRGQTFLRKLVPLPPGSPLGYHTLRVSLDCDTWHQARLVLCPDRAYLPEALERGGKAAGIAVSLYSMRSNRNWGCGDFTDLKGFSLWVAEEAAADFVALNPLHSIPNRQPFNTSPYLPNCSFFRNPLYLDIESIEDTRSSKAAQAFLASPKIQACLKDLRQAEYVEYEKVYAIKLRFLKLAFREFLKEYRMEGPRAREFKQYVAGEGALLDRFAVYCALEEVIHKRDRAIWIWPDWPPEFKDLNSPVMAEFARKHWRLILFYKYVQWQVDLQLADAQRYAKQQGLSIGLYHDLALATDRCGSDLWAHRAFYVTGCRVGSPPDGFAPKGQDWAFPPPNSITHRDDGYELFAESIRQNCRHGGALRIDHVMRFFRLFWIPEGKEATDGVYVRDFSEDLLRILALESVRNQVIVIGEDLGTVEPYIREALSKFGVLSYRLLYFEKTKTDEFKRPDEYPPQALVSVSTHDLPTLAGFWVGRDIEARRKAGVLGDEQAYQTQLREREAEKQKMLDLFRSLKLLPLWFRERAVDVPEFTGELHYAAVGFLALTPSMLMALNQEDLFKEEDQQNLPGTTEQYPNWRHKMRYTIEELRTNSLARDCTSMFRHWLTRTGRLSASQKPTY
jgi:4-alpha-glucanotransferase